MLCKLIKSEFIHKVSYAMDEIKLRDKDDVKLILYITKTT